MAWIAYWCVVGLLGVYAAHRLYLTWLYWRCARPIVAETPPLPAQLPVVTVQLPLFNEKYVAERLIDAAATLDWPADKLHIQILDDSVDETVELCRARAEYWRARGIDVEHVHRSDRTGFKAGALEAGLRRAKGDLVLVLDADFVPQPELLKRTVGYFADPKVGMVQVRWEHLNRDYSILTRIQALLLDGHFVVEQSVRAATGRFFNFNGTAGMWRRQALEDAGGWHHDTLTEDLDISYRALLAGWRFEYLISAAAPAELPVHMNGFKSQQFRWAKGSIQVARKLLPKVLAAPLPRAVKVEAFFHLTQNVPYLLTLLLVLLSVPALVLRDASLGVAWDIPLLLGAVVVLAAYCVTSQGALDRDGPIRVLLRLPALIAITVGISVSQSRAVIEGAVGHASEFIRTPKHGITGRRQAWVGKRYRGARTLIPIAELALAGFLLVSFALAVHTGRYMALPPLAVFSIGFAYVGLLSVFSR